MTFSVFVLSILIFLNNIGYGIYEIKENKNKLGGICVIVLATLMVIFVNYAIIVFK